MPRGDEIGCMTDEVVRDMKEKEVDFNRAFSWAAHRRGIYHGDDRWGYNKLFKRVLSRWRRRKYQKRSIRSSASGQLSATPKKRFPPSSKLYLRSSRTHAFIQRHPEKGYLYQDDEGYVHDLTSPYLPEAPC